MRAISAIIIIVLSAVLQIVNANPTDDKIGAFIIPKPQMLQAGRGVFEIGSSIKIFAKKTVANEAQFLKKYLQSNLSHEIEVSILDKSNSIEKGINVLLYKNDSAVNNLFKKYSLQFTDAMKE